MEVLLQKLLESTSFAILINFLKFRIPGVTFIWDHKKTWIFETNYLSTLRTPNTKLQIILE